MNTEADIQYKRMTEAPLPGLILSLGIPTIISMLITNIYNMADTYFVSKLGTSASGATGIVFSLMAIFQAIGFMFGHGAGSNIGRMLGQRDSKRAGIFASTSFFVSIGLGSVIAVLGLIFLTPLMYFLGSTHTILPYARTYGFYVLLSGPGLACSCVLNNILRYEGKAFLAMIGLTTGGILNIFGDMFFMYKLHMGVEGAGLSTAISQYISMAILYSIFAMGKTQSKLSIHQVARETIVYIHIFGNGFPSLTRQGLNSFSVMMLNQMASSYGDAVIAAMSIVSRCCMLLFSVGLGIGQGFQPVAGFNYGAKRYDRVKKAYFITLAFSTTALGVLALTGLVFSGHIIGLFRKDSDVITIGTFALRAQCLALLIIPLSVCSNMLFQSIGKSGRATLLACFRSGLFFIPLIIFLPIGFGVRGIQLAQPIADVCSALATIPFVMRLFKELGVNQS